MVNKQEVVNVLMNFLTFKESREELTTATAKLEQMNWSIFFLECFYCSDCKIIIPQERHSSFPCQSVQ